MAKKQEPVWIVIGNSESGDDFDPKRYDHKPTEEDLRAYIEKTGEELDIDGPGEYGSYVYLKTWKL